MSFRHWRLREAGWRRGLLINAAGAVGSGFALVAVAVAKFDRGAWVVIALVPLAVTVFISVHRHYERTDQRLAALDAPDQRLDSIVVTRRRRPPLSAALRYAEAVRTDSARVVTGSPRQLAHELPGPGRPGGRVLVIDPAGCRNRLRRRLARRPGVALAAVSRRGWEDLPASIRHAVVVVAPEAAGMARRGMALARALTHEDIHAVHVALEPVRIDQIHDAWDRSGFDVPLEVLPAPYREPGGPVRLKVQSLHDDGADVVSVVIVEIVPRWWQRPLYSSDARRVCAALRTLPRTAVVEDPVAL
jgi:hypothetical protein